MVWFKRLEGGTLALQASANVPGGSAVTLTVYEDVQATGTGPSTDPTGRAYDNAQNVTLSGGTTSVELDQLDGSPGNAVWVELDMTVTASDAPSVSSAEVAP
jgi:hypothetical protein